MLKAVGEVKERNRGVSAYTLEQEDGMRKQVSVEKIKLALKLNKVQISNLILKDGSLEFKKVNYENIKEYGLMNEGDFWSIINALSRTDIAEAERELTHILKYKLPIEKSVAFVNRANELIRILDHTSEKKITAFMTKVLYRCSDDQYTDFKYCVLWAGKDIYYKIVNSKNTKEMIKSLMPHEDILDTDGELFGYVFMEVID